MLKLEKLNQFYGGSQTIWDLDFSVREGECVCLMGRNGVGKTTLLKSLMGLIPLKSGKIEFDSRKISGLSTEKRVRLGIGYVPQGREIFPRLTVEENLLAGLNATKEKSAQIPDKVYSLFPVLKEMLARRGGDLSGGQQQQLAIARALVSNPSLLVLDEPTEGIQPNIVHDIGNVILKLNKEEKITVLLVEQKLPFARRVANSFSIMEKGRIVSSGNIEELSDELVNRHLSV